MNSSAILALSITFMTIILVGILALSPAPPVTVPGADKTHHFLAFAAMTFPMAALKPRWLPVFVLLALAYGGVIEFIQPHFGRSGDVMDWIADLVGVVTGTALGLLTNRFFIGLR